MRQPSSAADSSLAAFGALLDAVRGLRWHARRAPRLAVPGMHASPVRGTSAEFTEYRPYRQGDEVRRIDWRLLARTDRAQVRLSEERAITPTMFVLDASASLAFPEQGSGSSRMPGTVSKWALACELAIGLAAVAQGSGDPVGVTIVGAATRTLPPRTRRGAMGELIRVVAGTTPAGSAPIAPAISAALRSATRVVVITDLLGDEEDVLRAAREGVAAGSDVQLLHVIAREELELPIDVAIAQDPERSDVRRPLSADTRAEYARAFTAWREAMAQRWLASGAVYRVLVTGAEPTAHAIRRIVHEAPMIPFAVAVT